jgi:glycosyltransferase involved in cell wall biosynthesis
MKNDTAIFVIPRSSTAWKGNEAGWITAAGWASAGEQLWGHAIVATTDGVFSPAESMLFPRPVRQVGSSKGSPVKSIRKFVPELLITAYKDFNLRRSKPKVWPVERADVLKTKHVRLVWERHDLFPGIGRKLADQFGVPLVTSVEAPAVWEAAKWGVKRPVWGSLLEKQVEAMSLKRSDLVSCVSDEVRDKVISMGVDPKKAVVCHNRVNSTVFHPGVNGAEVYKNFNLIHKKVIGWTGSFRGFHAIDTLVHAFKLVHEKCPDTVLMLLGDGLEFEKIQALVRELGLTHSVLMPGRQPVNRIPAFLVNFHIAVVTAQASQGFHYSPLKLREYLATGRAIIAPKAGDLPELFADKHDLLFYEPGDTVDLKDKILCLLEDAELHTKLTKNAVSLFEREGTWIHELKKVCDLLDVSY